MSDRSPWHRWGRYAVAAVLAGIVAWFAFVVRREVPVLDLFDLGIHEVGHLLAAFTPRMVMFLAGSVAQIAVPLGLAWYFGIARKDAAGGGFCLTWAGASMWDVSVYVADAPVQALPLIGGGEHDWAYLLGARGWDVMHLADEIAGFLDYPGAILAVTGIVIAAWAAVTGARRAPAPIPTEVTASTAESDPWIEAASLPFRHDPLKDTTSTTTG